MSPRRYPLVASQTVKSLAAARSLSEFSFFFRSAPYARLVIRLTSLDVRQCVDQDNGSNSVFRRSKFCHRQIFNNLITGHLQPKQKVVPVPVLRVIQV
jgi:hypothetical protein